MRRGGAKHCSGCKLGVVFMFLLVELFEKAKILAAAGWDYN